MNSVVMAGALSTFDVPSLLQAVSLSRQYTLIRLWDKDRQPSGEIRLKAGQLVDAHGGGQRGKAALYAILRSRHHFSFRVERLDDPVNLPEPVGPLASLLLAMPPAATVAAVEPVPPPRGAPRPQSGSMPSTVPPVPPSPEDSQTRVRIPSAVSAVPAASGGSPRPVDTATSQPLPVTPMPRGVTEPRRLSMAAMPAMVTEMLEDVDGLQVALVLSIPQARCFTRWHRAVVPVPISALAGFATRWLLAHRQSFNSVPGMPRGTVELAEGILVLDPVSEARLIGYFFEARVPHGLIRLRVRQLAERMAHFHVDPEIDAASSHASLSGSGYATPAVTA